MLRVSFALGSVSVFAAADHGAEGGGYYTPYLVPCGGSLWYGFEHLGPFLVRKKSQVQFFEGPDPPFFQVEVSLKVYLVVSGAASGGAGSGGDGGCRLRGAVGDHSQGVRLPGP